MPNLEEVDASYRYYRAAGLTVSATTVSFGAVLMGWAVAKPPPQYDWIYPLQVLSALGAVISAFVIQFCQCHGYKNQAQAAYQEYTDQPWETRKESMDRANQWFRVLDLGIWAAVALILLSLLLSAALWGPFSIH